MFFPRVSYFMGSCVWTRLSPCIVCMGFKGRRSGLNASLGLLVGGVTTTTTTTTHHRWCSIDHKKNRKKKAERKSRRETNGIEFSKNFVGFASLFYLSKWCNCKGQKNKSKFESMQFSLGLIRTRCWWQWATYRATAHQASPTL